MYNNKIKTSFVSPELLKVQANKTGFNIIIVHIYIRKKIGYKTMLDIIFPYG